MVSKYFELKIEVIERTYYCTEFEAAGIFLAKDTLDPVYKSQIANFIVPLRLQLDEKASKSGLICLATTAEIMTDADFIFIKEEGSDTIVEVAPTADTKTGKY